MSSCASDGFEYRARVRKAWLDLYDAELRIRSDDEDFELAIQDSNRAFAALRTLGAALPRKKGKA